MFHREMSDRKIKKKGQEILRRVLTEITEKVIKQRLSC